VSDDFDPRDPAAADRLDAAIEARAGGDRSADVDEPTASLLGVVAKAYDRPVPAGLSPRVTVGLERRKAAAREARLRPARVAAAVLGLLLVVQGLPGVFAPQWFATEVLEAPRNDHVFREASFALFAVAALLLWAAARPRWLPPAVGIGCPLALVFAVNGASEIAHFRLVGGGGVHLAVTLAGVALAVAWRYGSRPNSEERGPRK
jgi:hypothetical protein